MIDEEIAKMLRKQRIANKKEEERKQEILEQESINEEELLEQILKGHAELQGHEFDFKRLDLLENRVSIMLPDYPDFVVEDDKDMFYNTYSNELGYSCNLVLLENETQLEPMKVYKERMEKGTKQSGLRYKWQEEGIVLVHGLKIYYLNFLVNTGLGTVQSCMYYAYTKYGRFTCTMNCEHKDSIYWKPISKALAQTIIVK